MSDHDGHSNHAMSRDYCTTLDLGLDLDQVPRSDKFLAGVQHLVERHAGAGSYTPPWWGPRHR